MPLEPLPQSVQRHVIDVFGGRHIRQQTRTRIALLNRASRQIGDDHAAIFIVRIHVLGTHHFDCSGHTVQIPRDLLTNALEGGDILVRLNDVAPARQIRWQGLPAQAFARLGLLHIRGLGLGLYRFIRRGLSRGVPASSPSNKVPCAQSGSSTKRSLFGQNSMRRRESTRCSSTSAVSRKAAFAVCRPAFCTHTLVYSRCRLVLAVRRASSRARRSFSGSEPGDMGPLGCIGLMKSGRVFHTVRYTHQTLARMYNRLYLGLELTRGPAHWRRRTHGAAWCPMLRLRHRSPH